MSIFVHQGTPLVNYRRKHLQPKRKVFLKYPDKVQFTYKIWRKSILWPICVMRILGRYPRTERPWENPQYKFWDAFTFLQFLTKILRIMASPLYNNTDFPHPKKVYSLHNIIKGGWGIMSSLARGILICSIEFISKRPRLWKCAPKLLTLPLWLAGVPLAIHITHIYFFLRAGEHGPRPAASGRTQDLWHSFSQYGPPGRQIIYIFVLY